MREKNFIYQNKHKWTELEKELKKEYRSPGKLSKLFIQVTDDLSYAQTFYKNRSVKFYLNGLARGIFRKLYETSKIENGPLKRFWQRDLPLVMYSIRKELLIVAVLFLSAVLIGAFSAANDQSFIRLILGDSYVDMTIKNIEKGDPMAVYKKRDVLEMFFGITINNIRVAFLTFVGGILAGIGSLAIMFHNGIMLGSFQYFFIERGLFAESFLAVYLHGTLELSAIVIAGAAGFTLAKGLLFPGSYTRLQSLQAATYKGVLIMMGITPVFIVAGFIEGFLTRFTDAPTFFRLLIIFSSFAFIIGYFVVYPFVARKKYGPPPPIKPLDFRQKFSGQIKNKIMNTAEVLAKSYYVLTRDLGRSLLFVFFISGITGILSALILTDFYTTDKILGSRSMILYNLNQLFSFEENYLTLFPILIQVSALLYLAHLAIVRKLSNNKKIFRKQKLKILASSLFTTSLILVVFLAGTLEGLLISGLAAPLIFLIHATLSFNSQKTSTGGRLNQSLTFLFSYAGRCYSIHGILVLISFLLVLLSSGAVVYYLLEPLELLIHAGADTYYFIKITVNCILAMGVLVPLIWLMALSYGILYFSLEEIHHANGLREEINALRAN